ncbi:hypothetical protein DL767_000739 [Monosporascus sp. MG133]|nr:hypothetical protein DL767_000739 [Monosporascus sp. MG133]
MDLPSTSIQAGQGPSAVPQSPQAESNRGKFSIYASTRRKKPGQGVKILDVDTATDKFVASLNKDQVIILSDTPNPTASFDSSDETRKWFTSLDRSATASLTLDSTPQQNVKSFLFEFKEPWPLTFSSAQDVLLYTFGAPAQLVADGRLTRIVPPGLDAEGKMLTCGLDILQTRDIGNIVIGDLFNFVGEGGMVDFLPSGIPNLPVTLAKFGPNYVPQRNAMWFVPSFSLQTTIRLQFQLPDFGKLQAHLGAALEGFTIKNATVICRKKTVLGLTEAGSKAIESGQVLFRIECSVQAGTPGAPRVAMAAGVEYAPSGINLTLLFTSKDPFNGILQWLAWLAGDATLEEFVKTMLKKEENGTMIFTHFTLRRLTVGLDTDDDKEKPRLSSFSLDIEVSAAFGRGNSPNPVVFLLSYHWSSYAGGFGTLAGQLWNDFDSSNDWDLLPWQESWTILQPKTPSPASSIDIASLIPTQKIIKIPDTLPSEIQRAYVELSQDSFAIRGTITAKPVSPKSMPQPYLGELFLDASFNWGQSSSFTLTAGFTAGIEPSNASSDTLPALFTGQLKYDSKGKEWDLKATIDGLYASTLVEFFGSDDQKHVMPLIESIAIGALTAEYKYKDETEESAKSVGSEFTINGNILIASLELGLCFHTNKDGFQFKAKLNPQNKDAAIGDVLTGILGPDDGIELPDFVTNMKLVGIDKDAFSIDVQKAKATKQVNVDSFQFLAGLKISDLSLTFAQLHSIDWRATDPPKRLLRTAIRGFADKEIEIPLVGKLKQPLDELYFLWVQNPPPPNSKDPSKAAGFTRKDLDQINSRLKDKILVRDKVKKGQQKPTDMMVAAGCHFAIITRDSQDARSCLLDYNFMKPKPPAIKNTEVALVPKGKKKTAGEDDGGPISQAPFKKKAGPLSIRNVGLKCKEGRLFIMFDATFEMGPIGFSLIGFSLGAKFKTLDEVPNINVNFNGLSAAFNKPPLTIAGIIRHGNDGGLDYCAGGMIIGYVPYQFGAAGFYGKVTPSDPAKSSFRSIFVFAKLDGPLVTLEFAEITGICGGFGYNSNLRVPTADEIYQFPFVASTDLGGTENALQVLKKLTDPGPAGWFQPLDKVYWGAVGLKVDAFQMLSVDAVLMVQFGTSIKLGLFAVALADIPTAKSPVKYAHVELGISAVADPDYGTLKIEAQLSPRSFIFHPDCHLTGGAALYYWFDAPHADSSKVGSFVFTLGGYHEAYELPPDYPNPPRLAISWSLRGSLSISGEAYFAITPKACMGGGRLHASFSAGPIGAWFDAFADFLINYKPFHFLAQAGLAVGVSFNVDSLFVHTHTTAEIGAQLYLWGPPLAGRVHVDFWITAFDIDFGDSDKEVKAINLLEFYLLVLQASSQPSLPRPQHALGGSFPASQGAGVDREADVFLAESGSQRPKNEGHVFLAQSGLMNPDDKPERTQNQQWLVRGSIFSFVIGCKMAINSVKLDANEDPVLTNGDPANGIDVFSKPMHLTSPMTSTLIIKATQTVKGITKPAVGWQFDKHMKFVPRGLWAKYDPRDDPAFSGNDVADLLNSTDGSMPLMMGVEVKAPKAIESLDPFPVFNIADAELQRIGAKDASPRRGDSKDWEPGKPFGNDEIEKQYKAVYDAWVNPAGKRGTQGQKEFVRTWATALGWNATALSSIASIPERLKGGFTKIYVAPPLLTK